MLTKLVLLFNFLIICSCEIFPERRAFKAVDCRADEVFTTCGRSCHPTCEFTTEQQQICTRECVMGCFCADNLLRDEKGNCVTKDKCPSSSAYNNQQNPYVGPESRAENSPSEPIDPERTAYSADKCRADEDYKTCGSPCDDTCTTVVDKSLRPCTLQCLIGCFCKKPLVRDADGNCIEPSRCPGAERTIPGTRFTTSRFRPTNPFSTSDIRFPLDSPIEGQTIDNTPIDDGNVARPSGQPTCSAGEFYTTCGQPCPDTCETVVTTPAFECPKYCIAGCYCKPGYVRDPRGNCIPKEMCTNFRIIQPQQFPENSAFQLSPIGLNLAANRLSPARYVSSAAECRVEEEFNICGSDCIGTCESRDSQCSYQCLSGCFCRAPLIRARDGSCIEKDRCPRINSDSPQRSATKGSEASDLFPGAIKPERFSLNKLDCRNDEEFKFCGSACSATCLTISNPQFYCGVKCVVGCFCKDSLVRAADGSCIPADQCPINDTTSISQSGNIAIGKPPRFSPTDNTNYFPVNQQPGKTNYPSPLPLQPDYPAGETGKTNYPAPKPLQPNFPPLETGKTNYPSQQPKYPGSSYPPTKGQDGLSKTNFRSPADLRRTDSRYRSQTRSYGTKSK